MDDPGPSAAYLASFPQSSSGPPRPPSPPLGPTDLISSPEDDPTEPEQALYALLNLPSTASDAEIRERYRSLVVTYHPDRQRTDAARAAAHRHFQTLQRAYEVLSDVESRTVYDLYGEEGLQMRAADREGEGSGSSSGSNGNGQLGRRNMTSQELREHFQSQYIATKAIEVDQLVKSRGDMTAVLDARAVFAPKAAFRNQALPQDPISRMGRLRVGQINMKHSFEVPITLPWDAPVKGSGQRGKGPGQNRTQVQIQGQMAARNGAGGGNVVGTVRHQFSPSCWGEVGYSAMAPRIMTAKGAYSIDEYTYVTANLISPTFLAPPTIGLQLGRRLYANTTGYISYKSGFFTLGPWGASLPATLQRPDRSALAVGLTNSTPAGTGWTVETQAGVLANHITADYAIRWMGLKWKLGAAVGTDTGINVFMDAEGKVSAVSRVGMVVSAELGGGVSMRFKFSRLGQRISVPIMLSQNLNPYIVLGSTVLPFSMYAAAYQFVLMPRKKRRIANRASNLRAEHADHIAQTRREALEAIDLMSRSVHNKVAAEREKGGLIILEAQYGLASAFSDRGIRRHRPRPPSSDRSQVGEEGEGEGRGEEEEVVIDVTMPVQALVVDSKLSIPGGRGKNTILGFWDPCIGEPKKLRIRYLFRDQVHQVTIDDGQMRIRLNTRIDCAQSVNPEADHGAHFAKVVVTAIKSGEVERL